MKLRLNRIHYPVTALGPGTRLGIWFQGCRTACAGCLSRDTWKDDGGRLIEVEELVDICYARTRGSIDGITLTGGEPFNQQEALTTLLDALESWRTAKELDILCYSGYPLAHLQQHHAAILARLDALIPEPYLQECCGAGPWRGSANQPLLLLTERARTRYALTSISAPPIQIGITDNSIWFIGIPRPGDMQRIRALAQQQGLFMENVSWPI